MGVVSISGKRRHCAAYVSAGNNRAFSKARGDSGRGRCACAHRQLGKFSKEAAQLVGSLLYIAAISLIPSEAIPEAHNMP